MICESPDRELRIVNFDHKILNFWVGLLLVLGISRKEMAREEEGKRVDEEYVYRISTAKEWFDFQKTGSSFGGDLDSSTSCFHLSNLLQVQPTLQRFFADTDQELYLLQIDAKKLGDGLMYELVEGTHWFPHFYGPSRSFAPLPLDAVTKAEKITLLDDGKFSCSLLD